MTDTKDKAMTGLSEQERHCVEHMRYQVKTASVDHPECSFDVELIETVVALIDRLTPPAAQAEEEIEAAARRMWESEPVIYAWGPQERHHVSWKEAIERDLAGVGIFRQFARAALRSAQAPVADHYREAVQIAIRAVKAEKEDADNPLDDERKEGWFEAIKAFESELSSAIASLREADASYIETRTYADGIEDSWQPIETAPKDGKIVLLLSAGDTIEIDGEKIVRPPHIAIGKWWAEGTSWVDEHGQLGGDCYELAETGVWESGGGWFQPNEVTHWAAVPAHVRALANKASG